MAPHASNQNRASVSLVRRKICLLVVFIVSTQALVACSLVGGDETATNETIGGETAIEAVDSTTSSTTEADGLAASTATDSGAKQTTTETTSATTTTGVDADLAPLVEAGFCPDGIGRISELRFNPGDSGTSIDMATQPGQVDLFRLDVADGQIMTIDLNSPDDDAGYDLFDPGRAPLFGPFTNLIIERTTAGTTWICARPGPTGSDYRLAVTVIDDNTPTKIEAPWCGDSVNDRGEIRFDAGQFSTTIDQAVILGERDLYTFDAAAGQDLELFIVEENATFALRSPSGEIIFSDVSDFRIPLPEDGIYDVCVGSIRGNAAYSLYVEIG